MAAIERKIIAEIEVTGLKLKLMPEMRKRPRIKKTESEIKRFKPFSQRNNNDQWLDVLYSSASRVTLIRFIASFFFTL